MTVEPTTTQDKQITIDVPEDRVAEFYAFYGRFLAGPSGRRGRGRGPGRGHGHGHEHGRHCGPHHRHAETPAAADGEPQTA
ncbi:MAG TPA: hypothetical protein VHZ75_06440 [Solirubrobacteraceae bacterium]|jgi:hypothetical protein|nr:hypothetical protein [Solirubrobacteraceae bacterium]